MRFFPRGGRRRRRGLSATEWVVIGAVLLLGIVGTVSLLGTASNDQLETTRDGVGDPSQLRDYWNSQ